MPGPFNVCIFIYAHLYVRILKWSTHTNVYTHLQGDVVELYLDDGRLVIPPSVSIPFLPPSTLEPVHGALARILNPGIEFRDHLFGMTTQKLQPNKSTELQVKKKLTLKNVDKFMFKGFLTLSKVPLIRFLNSEKYLKYFLNYFSLSLTLNSEKNNVQF